MPDDAAVDTLTVPLGERSYEIAVGPGLIAGAGRRIKPLVRGTRAVVVTDATVAGHWLRPLQASLDDAGLAHRAVVLPAGEGTKDFATLERLVRDLLSNGLERTDALVALGGGVIGDLTGFAAAVALRGVDFIQVPTTLLAQVDSSVGGKTGINTPEGKNLVGAFHQPRLVLADTDTLSTLPRRELGAGYAEVVKYGVIDDADFFAWLEANGAAVMDLDAKATRHAVLTSCAAKARIVADDEREKGKRALLNLGHTFGHALEAQSGFSDTLLHGEAVAIGMVMALETSERLGLAPGGTARRLAGHLAGLGLPAGLDGIGGPGWTAEAVVAHMAHDKKVEGGRITFVLARGIGQAFLSRDVDMDVVARVVGDALSKAGAAA